MKHSTSAVLKFKPELNAKSTGKELSKGLSAIVHIDGELWVANDESVSLERLTRQENGDLDKLVGQIYDEHEQFLISDYLSLPLPLPNDDGMIEEIDIEGLDINDDYIWLVGSHSLKRKTVDAEKSASKNIERLAKVSSDGNRYLLARIPLLKTETGRLPIKEFILDGRKRTAAQLPGSDTGNDLTNALEHDKHLEFSLNIPGKDNGFDIEGLAAGDNGHIFIGLRGPVLRGWTVILELELEANDENPLELKMKKFNSGNQNSHYRKHFFDLGGLGIRDLCKDGPDLLILAGPTMTLEGETTIFRWKDGMQSTQDSLNFRDGLEQIRIDIPNGKNKEPGKDNAEGITLLPSESGNKNSILVVYDSASSQRQEGSSIKGDIFEPE